LVWLGIRGFNPKLKKAPERLEGLRTPEGERIPPNTLSELHRDMERRWLLRDQIRLTESARRDRLEHAPGEGAHAMVRLLAREGIWHRDGRHAGAGGAVAKLARSTRRSALCGPRWLARREREEAPQERTGAIRESSGSAGHDPISVAILFQKDSALAQWFRARTENAHGTRKTMIVALAPVSLSIWRLVRTTLLIISVM